MKYFSKIFVSHRKTKHSRTLLETLTPASQSMRRRLKLDVLPEWCLSYLRKALWNIFLIRWSKYFWCKFSAWNHHYWTRRLRSWECDVQCWKMFACQILFKSVKWAEIKFLHSLLSSQDLPSRSEACGGGQESPSDWFSRWCCSLSTSPGGDTAPDLVSLSSTPSSDPWVSWVSCWRQCLRDTSSQACSGWFDCQPEKYFNQFSNNQLTHWW